MTSEGQEPAEPKVRRRVRQVGTVASISGKKSVVVQVERRVKHPRYQKYLSRRAKFHAHDEKEECRVGDQVELVSSRPLSARKRWRVSKVLRRAVLVRSGKGSEG